MSEPDNASSFGLDGMLAGYALLDPKDGWAVLTGIAADRKREFTTRYAALRTVRFFHDSRPDVMPADTVLAAMKTFAEQEDIADIAIDDLRKWQRWDQADFVLGFAGKETHADPLVKRAILKYALLAAKTGNKPSGEYVDALRKVKPQLVADAEALIDGETPKKK